MADGVILTDAGRNLLALAMTGKTLTFTRAFIGEGILPANSDPAKRTALISPKLEIPILSLNRTNEIGTCELIFEVNNQNLTQGFFVNEYGLFARVDNEPETLYAYRNTGANLQFLPAFNNIDLIHYSLSLIVVISQAKNVTAVINNQLVYITRSQCEARMANLFQAPANLKGFWTYAVDNENVLRPKSFADVKQAFLGSVNLSELLARIEILEDNLAQTLLTLELQNLYPGYTHYIIEDFINPDQIDMFETKITSVTKSQVDIFVDSVDGIIPGSWYLISDGLTSELVQVDNVSVIEGVNRVTLADVVKNSYTLENSRLYRTTCYFFNNSAIGPDSNHNIVWIPATEWHGINQNDTQSLMLDSSVANSGAFNFISQGTIDNEGFITLAENIMR